MILYDRIFSPYVRRLANRTVVVEKGTLNLLVRVLRMVTVELLHRNCCLHQGLSTEGMMATIVSRLKERWLLGCFGGSVFMVGVRWATHHGGISRAGVGPIDAIY